MLRRWQANFVDRCVRHRAAGGRRKRSLKQYISSSSLFRHVCSDFPRRTRSSSVKLRSSVGAPWSVLDDDALSESTMSRDARVRGGEFSGLRLEEEERR